MARVVVNVMPKAEILDPQGQAVHRALGRIGVSGVSDVRQGKRFELEVDDSVTEADLRKLLKPSSQTPSSKTSMWWELRSRSERQNRCHYLPRHP